MNDVGKEASPSYRTTLWSVRLIGLVFFERVKRQTSQTGSRVVGGRGKKNQDNDTCIHNPANLSKARKNATRNKAKRKFGEGIRNRKEKKIDERGIGELCVAMRSCKM